MASIVRNTIVPQAQGIDEAIPIWLKLDWSPEIEQGIYKDWGRYYSRRRRENIAMHYFDKAIDLCPEDYLTLYHRSQSKRKTANMEGALCDSFEAQEIVEKLSMKNCPINLEVCNALYESNQFENAKAELHDNTRIFTGNKTKSFEDRLIVIDENIKDTCGAGLSPFILENEKLMYDVKTLLIEQQKFDDRPLWKTLKEQGKCDVLSIPDMEEILLSPLEIARRKRAFDICNQVYLDRSWIDVLFLKNLRGNPNLLLEQCKNSSSYLSTLTVKHYDIIKKFFKMIHARSPLYYVRYKKYSNKKLLEKFREALLFRIQYQTRRNMFTVLRTIRNLRRDQNLPKLSKYVEEVMGDYVVLKTNRIMPWKFEFINEVYNTLALALVEQYKVPKRFRFVDKDTLLNLLHHSTDKSKEITKFVFGDRSTHENEDFLDTGVLKSRQIIARLESRIRFAKYSIEKCYLLHQIANTHLLAHRHAECCFFARKAIEECKNCESDIWKFLSTIIILKSSACLKKIERVRESLASAQQIADKLGSPNLIQFVEMCILCNERLATPSSRRESKMSGRSSGSGPHDSHGGSFTFH